MPANYNQRVTPLAQSATNPLSASLRLAYDLTGYDSRALWQAYDYVGGTAPTATQSNAPTLVTYNGIPGRQMPAAGNAASYNSATDYGLQVGAGDYTAVIFCSTPATLPAVSSWATHIRVDNGGGGLAFDMGVAQDAGVGWIVGTSIGDTVSGQGQTYFGVNRTVALFIRRVAGVASAWRVIVGVDPSTQRVSNNNTVQGAAIVDFNSTNARRINLLYDRQNSSAVGEMAAMHAFRFHNVALTEAEMFSYANNFWDVDEVLPPAAPALSLPTKIDTDTTVTGGFTTDTAGGTARAVWIESAAAPTQPTPTQVHAGQNAAGTSVGVTTPAALTITSPGAKTMAAATGLTAGLTYWGFVSHQNAGAQRSDVLALGPVYPGTGRSVSDVSGASYTASSGVVLADMLNENAAVADAAKDTTFITSPSLTGSFAGGPIMRLNRTYTPGTYTDLKVRKWVTGGTTGSFRVNFLNDANAIQGQTAVQAMTATPTTYTLSVTLTGNATRWQIEERE